MHREYKVVSVVSGLTLRMLLMGMSVKVPVGTAAKAGAAGGLGVGAAVVGAAAGVWQYPTENFVKE